MKKLVYSLMVCVALVLAACSSAPNVDYKALSAKAENNTSALTQKDYSEMIEYIDYVVTNKDEKLAEQEETMNIMMTLMGAAFAAEGIPNDYPALDSANKAKFEKLSEKFKELYPNM